MADLEGGGFVAKRKREAILGASFWMQGFNGGDVGRRTGEFVGNWAVGPDLFKQLDGFARAAFDS